METRISLTYCCTGGPFVGIRQLNQLFMCGSPRIPRRAKSCHQGGKGGERIIRLTHIYKYILYATEIYANFPAAKNLELKMKIIIHT